MRFRLNLRFTSSNRVLPINYQYPIHSWIYRVIHKASPELSKLLHDQGYFKEQEPARRFKLFTFSQLRGEPFKILRGSGPPEEQRIGFYGEELQLSVSFWLPEPAEQFIRGLFLGDRFSLGDRKSRVDLEVSRIEALPRPLFKEEVKYQASTPIVVSIHVPEYKHPQYLAPNSSEYIKGVLMNLQRKAETVGLNLPAVTIPDNDSNFMEGWELKLSGAYRRKGVIVKQYTPMQNKIIGYTYDFILKAPPEVQQLAYYAGFGEDNSMGFGYVRSI